MSRVWSIVIPQKDLRRAKSRLELPAAARRRIVVAMLEDTISAVLGTSCVRRVILICDNTSDAKELERPDVVTRVRRTGVGLNGAVEAGAALARDLHPRSPVAVLPADLPALRSTDLMLALDLALAAPRSFVADAAGVGTTLLAATAAASLGAAYGAASRSAHLRSGAMELGAGGQLGSLHRDVDDVDALRKAVEGGGAYGTRAAYADLSRHWVGAAR